MQLRYQGKVRDIYDLPDGNLLFVASDRISAYDYVLATPIPDKGKVLTQLSLWWFERLADLIPNHVISNDVPPEFAGRAMVCESLEMLPVECVARGYLAGSGLAEYQADGTVCGIALPPGLTDGSRLDEAIFTPATKAAVGDHDENVDFNHVQREVGSERAEELRRLTLEIYEHGEEIARERGLILADTKFEFGVRADGAVVLADEVLTPDSSRYWPADAWDPGHPQPSFDKQYVRDWLDEQGWDHSPPAPKLPDEVIANTSAKYREAYERITGRSLD